MKKKISIIAIIILLILIGTLVYGYVQKASGKYKNPVATITVEGYENPIIVELYPEYATNTVSNFIALANNGFYDGLTFHRIIEDFMIQGGDINGDGTGSPKLSAINKNIEEESSEDEEYAIPGEFTQNGYYKNTLRHERGVISMARSDYSSLSSSLKEEGYNSAGSQFFIMTENTPSLNGLYAAFGKVISGMETVDEISKLEKKVEVDEETGEETETDAPENPPAITSIKVETYGIDYGMPKTNEVFNYYNWLMQNYYSGYGY